MLECVSCSEAGLKLIHKYSKYFWRRFLTIDGKWIHHCQSESEQWTGLGEKGQVKLRTVLSTKKFVASVFWISEEIILTNYRQESGTMNGEYFAALLDRFNGVLKVVTPGIDPKNVHLHQNNGPAHNLLRDGQIVRTTFQTDSTSPSFARSSPV